MAQFRFQINDDPNLHAPVELDLIDAARAEQEAVELLVSLARSPSGPLRSEGHVGLTLSDAEGAIILRLSLVASRPLGPATEPVKSH
jgi:hypothetical protein